jgi:hypothetical protein
LKKQLHVELLDNDLWEQKVMNPDTKAYTQISDLPVAYRKFDENRKYPIRQVLQTTRIKRVDGSEWLISKGRLVGSDRAGNEVEHSFSNPELYYKPKNEYSPTERVCEEAAINPFDYRYTEYTLPFNEKNFDNLYKQRPINTESSSSVSLIIYQEGSSDKPHLITNVDQFKNKPFDDIWIEAITPRYKLDRSYKDNLESSHIG